MAKQQRIVSKWTLFPIIVSVLFVVGCPLYFCMGISSEVSGKQRKILYHTNHTDVLDACRFIIANQTKFRPDPDWNSPTKGDFSKPDPTDPLMPAVISSMGKMHIFIEPDSVRLELGGGFQHYGLEGFKPGVKGDGTKELIPGLWYYDEAGKVPAP